ncbi:peptidoglycan -binding protein [Albirhodobacter sp. R86504]|uniref:peptidoglycan -binding protein n=1 Tax=Albirhodobacter sp. R86504 TaxID=3093848 RepID=UPI00366B8B2A
MALARRGSGQRFSANIWPGFVDAMTALLLVLMFVLTIFMVVQSVLRETITTQDAELSSLSAQISGLADALSLERAKVGELQTALEGSEQARETQSQLVASLTSQIAAQAAALGKANDQISDFEARLAALVNQKQASDAEIEALRDKLLSSEDEVKAMTLALEQARQEAEDTLTLLAAAQAAKEGLEASAQVQLTEAEKQAALLALAQSELAKQETASAEAARKVALLNEQVAALRGQLASLQAVLDEAADRDEQAKVQVDALGTQLNAALAQVAAEQRARAQLEEAEKLRAQAEAKDLERYRSEFFGRLSQLLAGREGVRVVGDRFVFSSEVLFDPGRASLAGEGRAQIASVVQILNDVAGEIPPELDWIIRVDGHTDDVPLSGLGEYADNWELSQARALSVVRFMMDDLGMDPKRLAPTGFGQYRPVAEGTSTEARAQNRRIELKLTER